MTARFRDRREAGRRLALRLSDYASTPDLLVLGLPRGGVPVAFEVAQALRAPLEVYSVRKLGVPGHGELAMGAIATGNTIVFNDDVIRMLDIPEGVVREIADEQALELAQREAMYRHDAPAPAIAGCTVIIVDDGLATGATMRAAVAAVRKEEARRIVVAVPVGSSETCDLLRTEVDEVVCLESPAQFRAVGIWYDDFSQTTDEEVTRLRAAAAHPRHVPPTARSEPVDLSMPTGKR